MKGVIKTRRQDGKTSMVIIRNFGMTTHVMIYNLMNDAEYQQNVTCPWYLLHSTNTLGIVSQL